MKKETILLLEDDPDVMRANKGLLELEGYHVLPCHSVGEARIAASSVPPDLMVLDVILPDGNGIDFCREYRDKHGMAVPVLFLTVMKGKAAMLAGYGAGGTDYLIKPFDADMLLLKVRALIESRKAAAETIAFGALRLDCIAGIAILDGAELTLTPKEFAMLKYLALSRDRYVSTAELYEKVWGKEAVDKHPVKQHMLKLRDKLSVAAIDIESEYGSGYRVVMKE